MNEPPAAADGLSALLAPLGPDYSPLRVGIVTRGHQAATILEQLVVGLQALPCIGSLIVVNVADGGQAPQRKLRPLLLSAYCALDRAVNGQDSFAAVDPSDRLRALGVAQFDDVEAMLAAGVAPPDVWVTYDAGIGDRSLAGSSRHGLWRCEVGSCADAAPYEPGAREFFSGLPTLPLKIRLIGATSAQDRLIVAAQLRTDRGHSLLRSRERGAVEITQLLIAALRKLAIEPATELRGAAIETPGPTDQELPGNAALLAWAAAPWLRRARRLVRGHRGRAPLWKIAVRARLPGTGIERVLTERSDFTLLSAPAGFAWADPHLVEHNGRTLLFAEELRPDVSGSGKIICTELDERGLPATRTLCVDRPYHLSFPQVFAHGGEHFMIPESSADGTVQLLRARRFPDDWVLEKILFRAKAVDTIAWHDPISTRWFFITSVGSVAGQYPYTLLFTADSLTGEWQPHPASPIATTVQLERNAGALFNIGGKLIRPVQDGLMRYGHSMQWQEITILTPSAYAERRFGRVEPDWAPDILATHSYSCTDRWEALDALVLERTGS